MSDKFIFRLVAGISVAVFILVLVLSMKVLPKPDVAPSLLYFLPKLNAILNGTCSVLLLTSLYFITQLNIKVHKTLNIIAFVLSAVFLLSYVTFHWLSPETLFGDVNGDHKLSAIELGAVSHIRPVYLVILISHIILAAAVLPLILLSFYFGLKMEVAKHRKLVRWSFPIWLYVTVTGVIVYIMISPYYHF